MCLVGIYFLIEATVVSQTYMLLKRNKKYVNYYSSFMCLDQYYATVYIITSFFDYTNDTAIYTIALTGLLLLVTVRVALLLLVSNLVSLLTILKRWCSC